MGWKKQLTVKNISFDYWHIEKIILNDTKNKIVRFILILYKDLATFQNDPKDYFKQNVFRITLGGNDYPLNSVDLKVAGKDNETLIYDKIKSVGELIGTPTHTEVVVIDGENVDETHSVDFTSAVLE